jgi:probable rRNA maturation factor
MIPFTNNLKELAVLIKGKEWKSLDLDLKSFACKIINYVLEHENIGAYEISVSFVNDAAIQSLNFKYRGNDKPTNVLSFIYNAESLCGDIILAYETILRESKEQKKNFQDHLAHLMIHGTLHLLGYDHEKATEAFVMEELEKNILNYFNISNPYEGEETISV